MQRLKEDHKRNMALLGGLVLTAVAVLIVTNLRAVSWDFALFPYVSPGRLSYYYINYYDFGFTVFANNRKNKASGIQLTRSHLVLCTLLLLSGVVLGPIGIIRSFPLISIY